ncbi:hypothetical protein K4K61_010073 [Colletotrichum sp. SAR11_59]|nr:hypothetical protein K4K61_010073 [Colletotrichum sp. SAR11_59]
MRDSATAEVNQLREELSSSQKDVSKERLEMQGLTTVLNGLKTAVEAIKAWPNGTGSAESDWQKAVGLLASRLNAFNIFDDGRHLTHSSVIHEVGMAIVRDAEFDKLRRFVATMEVNATYCFWQVVEAEEGDEIIRLENSKATCPLHTMEKRLSKSDKCLRFKSLVSEGADGALDFESTADGAVGTGGGAQDAGLDEENVQTPAEPTPTWGSSKTFLEATVDEAMDQGKYKATLGSIWPKARDLAADGDEIETYADAVSQIAVTTWGKLSVKKVKVKLDAIREGTYRELSRRDEKQYSFTNSEYRALRDSGFVKVIKWEVNDIPPFDERFRDHLQKNNMKTAGAVQPAPPAIKPVQDARVEDQRRRLSELALHCLRDHVMPGDMTSYMTDLADHAASLLNLRNKDDMRLSASDVDAVISDQWRVYNGDGKVVENAKAASSWYWSRKQEKQTQQKQQTQEQQQTPNVVHTSWLPPELAAPTVASAFSLPSRNRPPHGFPHSRR